MAKEWHRTSPWAVLIEIGSWHGLGWCSASADQLRCALIASLELLPDGRAVITPFVVYVFPDQIDPAWGPCE